MRRPCEARVKLASLAALILPLMVTSIATAAPGTGANIGCLFRYNPTSLSDKCISGLARDVTIGPSQVAECRNVKIDRSFTGKDALGTITIQPGGRLCVANQKLQIETDGIVVGGEFEVGTRSVPIGVQDIANQVTITFKGTRPCASPTLCEGFHKGIQVSEGGQLKLFGAKGVLTPGVSWTHLRLPAVKGSNTLELSRAVHVGPGAWQVDDWIAVATTSFSPFETEFVQIGKLALNASTGGTTVTLAGGQTLKYYHFGGEDPGEPGAGNFNASAALNYGVDERAEVGLISRNIKLTAQIPGDANSLHWGGEIRILKGFQKVQIQGVEIEKFGKDQLGGYPIHFHLVGPVTTNQVALIHANSIHHSYNKCVTIHSSHGVTIDNNVCARIVGHIFYEEIGDEEGIKFTKNLGLGAMSNDFDINASTPDIRNTLIKNFWWAGDNLTNDPTKSYYIGYDGFRVPNTDAQDNPTYGSCTMVRDDGGIFISNAEPPSCGAGEFYTEPASGFWIIHPGTQLIDNSIGGCQGSGRGYWYVPPSCGTTHCDGKYASIKTLLKNLKFQPVGIFRNNRVHGCFAGIYDEPEDSVHAEQLFPHVDANPDKPPLIAKFEGATVTRNRGRGIWMRPTWMAFEKARVATNRLNVTLVTGGGLDSDAPGVWALLKDSVIVGLSANNVDRFGPCPTETLPAEDLSKGVGGQYGCIDQTPGPLHRLPLAQIHGGDNLGTNSGGGYPPPNWNFFGYMIYDGPVRIFHNHFVNFFTEKTWKAHLTQSDLTFFEDYAKTHRFPSTSQDFIYEGDAALGWFDSNQSAYPTASASKELSFTNVELRHQVFTQSVGRGDFNDGDKNTALVDLDGSLAGFGVLDSKLMSVKDAFPISLNNLPFNASSNAVDECLAEASQDEFFEGRPTALMSPDSMATLEFGALYPNQPPPPPPADMADKPNNHTQILTFRKDSQDFGDHQFMSLHSRNAQGLWEPKVTSGYGYTVSACASKDYLNKPTDTTCDPNTANLNTGIPNYISVGLTDPVKPGIRTSNPFFVRLGICYTDKDGMHPAATSKFAISRGYKSYNGSGNVADDPDLRLYYNKLDNRYNGEVCHQLDNQDRRNVCPDGPRCTDANQKGCPAHGVTAVPGGGCVGSTQGKDQQGKDACIYDPKPLTQLVCMEGETSQDCVKRLDKDKYFYDAQRGMLFFYVVQEFANAFGPSPLGSCFADGTGDESCPDLKAGESYYACPPQGCIHYVVKLTDASGKIDSSWTPGRSNCVPYPTFAQDPPAGQLQLVLHGTKTVVQQIAATGKDGKFPHYEPTSNTAPTCSVRTGVR